MNRHTRDTRGDYFQIDTMDQSGMSKANQTQMPYNNLRSKSHDRARNFGNNLQIGEDQFERSMPVNGLNPIEKQHQVGSFLRSNYEQKYDQSEEIHLI